MSEELLLARVGLRPLLETSTFIRPGCLFEPRMNLRLKVPVAKYSLFLSEVDGMVETIWNSIVTCGGGIIIAKGGVAEGGVEK
jgi:hypothetical protein